VHILTKHYVTRIAEKFCRTKKKIQPINQNKQTHVASHAGDYLLYDGNKMTIR